MLPARYVKGDVIPNKALSRSDSCEEVRLDCLPQLQPSAQPCHLHRRHRQSCKRCAAFRGLPVGTGIAAGISPSPSASREAATNLDRECSSSDKCLALEGFSSKLQSQVLQSAYFRYVLLCLNDVESLVDELQNHADHAEPYTPHSHNDPSTLFCCIYRLSQLQPSKEQVQQLVGFKGSVMVRAAGMLHIRFSWPPGDAWTWLRKFLFDREFFRPGCSASASVTMGDWVESLLRHEKYYDIVLPRLPVSLKREIAMELVQLPELREAQNKNPRHDHLRRVGAQVDVLNGTTWCSAAVSTSSIVGRSLLVNVQMDDGSTQEVPCGLLRPAQQAKKRSRSPRSPHSTDKLCEEFLRRDRAKAVTDAKHGYFKPIPKLKKMLMTKDKCLRHSAPDETSPLLVRSVKEDLVRPAQVDHAVPEERRSQLMQVMRKYASGGTSRSLFDRQDRFEYHDWSSAASSAAEVLVPETLRLG
ncbi:SRL1 [Symbiodinium microadriaticum]|nr:SRL1 [Symbiodinium microadriaticum]